MKDDSKSKSSHKIDGWKMASKTREEDLNKTLEMYRQPETETLVIKVNKDDCGDCTKCFTTGNEIIYRIYIRQKK
jgi:hypothetical protein